ncbi:hypothetical protein ABT297_18035 [Dactylosporangium sp. NPDC000555]|uniref:hypothetical protein n=1 Tax=Dactylosporangium sp. NPDC000555 TaxID=3154260 RepID=UPI0033177A7B
MSDEGLLVLANGLIIVAITVFVIIRQFSVREVRPEMLVWTALLVARGCFPPGPARATVAGIGLLAAALVVSVIFGVLRGSTMPMWRADSGLVVRKGGRVTLWLWLATIAARLVLGAIGSAAFGEPLNFNALWLGMGVTLGVQHLVMTRRAAAITARDDAEPAAR